jgi:hypothetical protein
LKFFRRVWDALSSRRGSQTIEYVAVMAGAALLAMTLNTVMESDEIQNALREKIECVITQKCNETDVVSNKKIDDESSGYVPDGVISPVDDNLPESDPSLNPLGFNDYEGDYSREQAKDTNKSDQKPPEDEGFFGKLKREAWDGFKEKANDVWEGTKVVASDTWDGIQSGAEVVWDWTVEHKEAIGAGLTVAAGVGLLFVPGGQALGAGILIGAAVGGGISAAQGNDLKTIMADAAVGGLAGAVGGGVTGGVVRGVGRFIGGKTAQLMGNSTGASAGTIADDLFHGRKINWKNAAAAGVLAFGITHGVQVAKTTAPVFGITPKSQQVASQQLSKYADEMGEYRKVGGHHIHAKAAFKGHVNYDPRKGFSISQKFMQERGWNHQKMTATQQKMFKELAESGRPNSLTEQNRIAVEALVAGGAPRDEARLLVAQSVKELRKEGVREPTRVPWYDKQWRKVRGNE